MEKTKTNYNEQLNKPGDSAFIMKKHIDKNKNIKKAFIFVPEDKGEALLSLLNSKGGNNNIGAGDIAISSVLIRNNNIVAIVYGGTIRYGNYKNKGYTGRGVRLNEKHIEGLVDYAKTFGKEKDPQVIIDDSLATIDDSFKTTAAALTIDDLLNL